MDFEAKHIDAKGYDNKAQAASYPMLEVCPLCKLQMAFVKLLKILTNGIFKSPNLFQRSSMVYRPTNAVTNRPTHLTLSLIMKRAYYTIKGLT